MFSLGNDCRVALLVVLLECLGQSWFIENPANSCILLHPWLVWAIKLIQSNSGKDALLNNDSAANPQIGIVIIAKPVVHHRQLVKDLGFAVLLSYPYNLGSISFLSCLVVTTIWKLFGNLALTITPIG